MNRTGKGHKFKKGNQAAKGRKLVERELWDKAVTESDKVALITSVRDRLLSVERWTKTDIELLKWAWERMHGKPLDNEDQNNELVIRFEGNTEGLEKALKE